MFACAGNFVPAERERERIAPRDILIRPWERELRCTESGRGNVCVSPPAPVFVTKDKRARINDRLRGGDERGRKTIIWLTQSRWLSSEHRRLESFGERLYERRRGAIPSSWYRVRRGDYRNFALISIYGTLANHTLCPQRFSLRFLRTIRVIRVGYEKPFKLSAVDADRFYVLLRRKIF